MLNSGVDPAVRLARFPLQDLKARSYRLRASVTSLTVGRWVVGRSCTTPCKTSAGKLAQPPGSMMLSVSSKGGL